MSDASDLERLGDVVDHVLRFLLFRGGRAPLTAITVSLLNAVGPGALRDVAKALDLAERSGLFLTLGSELILCHRGWEALARSSL